MKNLLNRAYQFWTSAKKTPEKTVLSGVFWIFLRNWLVMVRKWSVPYKLGLFIFSNHIPLTLVSHSCTLSSFLICFDISTVGVCPSQQCPFSQYQRSRPVSPGWLEDNIRDAAWWKTKELLCVGADRRPTYQTGWKVEKRDAAAILLNHNSHQVQIPVVLVFGHLSKGGYRYIAFLDNE